MKLNPLPIEGCFEIILAPHHDERGYFMRIYDESIFQEFGLVRDWVQENQSLTQKKGTIRGLHFQEPPFAETKLVRTIFGSILDVIVDLRRDSPTYGKWLGVELSTEKQNMLFVPRGFAHGFCTLSEHVIVSYKVDSYYTPESEGGLLWNDELLGINWPESAQNLAEKDSALPGFEDFESPFTMSDSSN